MRGGVGVFETFLMIFDASRSIYNLISEKFYRSRPRPSTLGSSFSALILRLEQWRQICPSSAIWFSRLPNYTL